MTFNYNDYFVGIFFIPLILIVFSVLIFSVCLIYVFKYKALKERNSTLRLFVFTVFALIALISGLNQVNYMIYYDTESDTQQYVGEVTKISDVSYPPRFFYNDEIVSPKFVYIDSQEYYIMYIGEIEVGDIVTIDYLTNSKIILEIKRN